MSLMSSDMIYRDLHQKGLQLTPPSKVIIPDCSPSKSSLIKKISSIVSRSSTSSINSISPTSQSSPQIYQILYSAFIAINNNSIFIYSYNFDEINKNIQIIHEGTLCFTYNIQKIYMCQTRYVQQGFFPMLAKIPNGIVYFNYQLKNNTIIQRNIIKMENVLAAGWITDKQCIIVDNKNLYHFVLQQNILKQKSVKPSNLIIPKQYLLKKVWVLSKIDQHQDSIISIFYSVVVEKQNQQTRQSMKLKIRQFVRTHDGDITAIQPPIISDFTLQTQSLQYSEGFNIVAVGEYYCLQLSNQVLVVKKKFEKYRLLDNMMQIMVDHKVKLSKKGLIASIGINDLQLNLIQFADPKCNSRILDVIEFPNQLKGYNKYFKQIWPVILQKQYTLIFVFQKDNQILLSGIIKLQPIQKMLALAKKSPKQKLQILRDMAYNLGIKRQDFYLKLWQTSKKQNSDIYQYLLPCKDVRIIKNQLQATLRTRTIPVTQMLKIIQKITQLNLQNIKKQINITNYKQYVKNQFLRKKIILNAMDKQLDHRIFNKICGSSLLDIFYDIVKEQLDPVQPQFDPLHTNINYKPIKQQKNLKHVMQQFKVVLLQQYKSFLIQFLSKFPDKIVKVLTKFNFLLPNHPFEIQVQRPSKINQPILKDPKTNDTQQQHWFKTVTVTQWQVQMTKQKIQKILLNHYPTSKVTETVDQFYKSTYGKQFKRWKHGIIIANLDQYRQKLKNLSGVQLYLDVCQYANQLSVQAKQNGDPKISQKILNVLKLQNGLTQSAMHYCKLYANMHYFMLKNKILPKSKLQISYLTNLQPQNLLALFFLQNKQRKQHIFEDFKNLYQDKNQFNQILNKFVQSQNCSRIQLEILIKQIKLKGKKFQQDNQDIIQILISGICMKVQIRQNLLILDAEDDQYQAHQNNQQDLQLPCQIDQIQLKRTLALKINRIKKLKRCKQIFKTLKMQKYTYHELLQLQKDNNIFKQVLKRYFQLRQSLKKQQKTQVNLIINLQNQAQFDLMNDMDLLIVLVYLNQNVYYSAKYFDIFLLFGLEFISWRQFDIVKDLIKQQKNTLNTFQIQRSHFIQTLILRALDNIYLDQQIVLQDQTLQQIINIINLDDQNSLLQKRQLRKLDLISILNKFEVNIYPCDIHKICYNWKQQLHHLQIMDQLLDQIIIKIDFNDLKQIYILLEKIDKSIDQVNIYNVQYADICDLFARKLMENKRYKQSAQVLAFLMNLQKINIKYYVLTQVYLQSVALLYQQDQQKGKKLIEFFVQKFNYPDLTQIRLLLKQYFQNSDIVLNKWQENAPQYLPINSNLHYHEPHSKQKYICQIKYNDIWQICKKQASNPTQLYFCYYFFTFSLINPKLGFSQTVGIGYNLQKLYNIVDLLEEYIDKHQNLWFVNFAVIRGSYFFDVILVQAINNSKIQRISPDRRSRLDAILQLLRKQRNANKISKQNQKLLNILLKLKNQSLNKAKTDLKSQRFTKKAQQVRKQKQNKKKLQQQIAPQSVQVIADEKSQIFLNWRRVIQEKKHISNTSHISMSEKELIDRVYENQPQSSRVRQQTVTKFPEILPQKKFLLGLFQHQKQQGKNDLVGLIKRQQYQQVGKYPLNEVFMAIKNIFDEQLQRDYREISQILQALNIGDIYKRGLFILAKSYLDPLSNQIRKTLFPVQFFMTTIPSNIQQQKQDIVFDQIKQRIDQLSRKLTIYDLRQIASMMGIILGSSNYQAYVYFTQLQKIGQNSIFYSSSALMAQQCIIGLANSGPDLLCQFYKEILGKMGDSQLRIFVKELLIKTLSQTQLYVDVAEEIRHYQC